MGAWRVLRRHPGYAAERERRAGPVPVRVQSPADLDAAGGFGGGVHPGRFSASAPVAPALVRCFS